MPKTSLSSPADIKALEPTDPRPARTTYELLCGAARRHAGRVAIHLFPTGDPDGGVETRDYRALLASINRAARAFQSLSERATPVVSYLLPTLIDTHAVLWGAQAVGIANPINPLLSGDHIVDILRAAGTTVLVVADEPALQAKVDGIAKSVPTLRAVLASGPSGGLDAHMAQMSDAPLPPPRPDLTAALFHTGGTTGRPKLARLSHEGLAHAAWGAAAMLDITGDDVMVNPLPLFHIGGTIIGSLAPLSAGATIVHPAPAGLRDGRARASFWRQVEATRATILGVVPTMAASLLDVPVGGADLTSVRYIVSGAAALPPELACRFEAHVGSPVIELYGMTETSGLVTSMLAQGPRSTGAVGYPPPFSRIEVRAWAGRAIGTEALPAGASGVVVARGSNVFGGYVDPQDDDGAFTPDGWFVTGDIGHLDGEGRLVLTGRAKDVIIRGGHNIDPGAIEDAAMAHPAVELCAAVGEPDAYAGEVPVLFVKLVAGAAVDAADLEAFIAARIHEPPARPRAVYILDALPLTPIGKIFKPELRVRAAETALWRALEARGIAAACSSVEVEMSARQHLCVKAAVETSAVTEVAALARALNIEPAITPTGPA